MFITQVRNATMIIKYAGVNFLIDPIFAEKGTYPPFPSVERSGCKNPLNHSPVPVSQMIKADAVIITHLHTDHFDEEAKELLPKNIPVFVQNEADKQELLSAGFTDVKIMGLTGCFKGAELIKTPGRHGYDDGIVSALGEVCGVILRNKKEKTLYIAGDTVWCGEVKQTLLSYKPPVIILNAGANSVPGYRLIMGKEETLAVHNTLPSSDIIAVHMEGVNHWTLSRSELREFAEKNNFSEKLYIPEDGETLEF